MRKRLLALDYKEEAVSMCLFLFFFFLVDLDDISEGSQTIFCENWNAHFTETFYLGRSFYILVK